MHHSKRKYRKPHTEKQNGSEARQTLPSHTLRKAEDRPGAQQFVASVTITSFVAVFCLSPGLVSVNLGRRTKVRVRQRRSASLSLVVQFLRRQRKRSDCRTERASASSLSGSAASYMQRHFVVPHTHTYTHLHSSMMQHHSPFCFF